MKSLKYHLHQLLLLLLASLCLALVIATYSSIFVFSIKFYQKLYDSKFFYLGIFFIVCSSILCTKWALGAKGSGHDLGEEFFDEFNELNDIATTKKNIRKYFSEKTIVAKIISSILATLGGAALGKEGPLVHIGMSVLVSFKKRIKAFHIPLSSALTIGACIGFAAAFREPILGVAYMLEMYGVKKSKKYFAQNLLMLFCTIYLARYILESLLHIPPIIFHLPKQVASDLLLFVTQMQPAKLIMIITFAATAGAINATIIRTLRHYSGLHFWKCNTKILVITPLLVGAFIIFLAQLGSSEILGPGYYALEKILYNETVTVLDFIGKYLNCLLTMAISCAGGLVIPSLALGAMFGHLVGGTSPQLMILLCTTTFLAPTARAPLTASLFVIIFTGLNLHLALYVLVAAYLSCYIADLIGKLFKLAR